MRMDIKPVRKIRNSHNSAIRGVVASNGNGLQINVESSLERDFVFLSKFDINVESCIEQPVCIEYELDGKRRKYTPDFLVQYLQNEKKPALIEIKYRKDIRKDWNVLKPKFKAAKQYALLKGWEFKIYTENEIRGEYLKNAKFLITYRNNQNLPKQEYKEIILRLLNAVKETTPHELLLMAFQDRNKQVELIPSLWSMVASGLIGCYLFDELTMASCIWCVND
jgi:hypothetical protein